jgi:leader peptidase (prepilin peptidase)/N-methyltransferase
MSSSALILAGVVGAVLGSFANVIIHRVPRDESIVHPPSRCPGCGTPIRPWDNIPLLSFLLLRGRCRDCGRAISWRYPLVEALMAVLAVAVVAGFPDWLSRLAALALVFLLVVITFIDLDHQLILDRVSLPGIAVGLVFAILQGRGVLSLLSALGAGALIAAIVIVSRGGMGGGDVKLAALMGAFLGWPGIAVALFSGFTLGGVVGMALLALRLRGRKDAIPFGPALAAGALVGLFWGEAIARWYWH